MNIYDIKTEPSQVNKAAKAPWGTICFPTADKFEKYMIRAKNPLKVTWPQFQEILDKKRNDVGSAKAPLRTLHVAVEFMGAEVGGVAAVTKSIIPQQNGYGTKSGRERLHFDSRIITPGYNFLLDKLAPSSLKKLGTLPHYYDGKMMESTIYRAKVNGMRHYLVQPDPRVQRIFDVGTADNIYANLEHSPSQDRHLYFASAASAFAAYKRKSFHALHLHNWQTGLTAALLKQIYSHKMVKEGKSLPAIVFMMHNLGSDQGHLPPSKMPQKIGLMRKDINQAAEGMLNADRILTVSEPMLQDGIETKGYNLQRLFQGAQNLGKIEGISNGIPVENYDPKSEKVYGNLPLPDGKTVDLRMKEGESITSWKSRLKEYLVTWNILSNTSLPLVVYCGRASSEKGFAMIPEAKQVLARNASFLVMCVKTQDETCAKIVDKLVEQHDPEKNFAILPTIDKQKPVRSACFGAADFIFSPSHLEADGISLKELLATGSLAISSNVCGPKATVNDLFDPKKRRSAFSPNGTFYNDSYSISNMRQAIRRMIYYWENRTPQQKAELQTKIMEESRKRFDWVQSGKLDSYFTAYQLAHLQSVQDLAKQLTIQRR